MVMFGQYQWIEGQIKLLASQDELDYYEVRISGNRLSEQPITAFDNRNQAEDFFFLKMKEMTSGCSNSEVHQYIQKTSVHIEPQGGLKMFNVKNTTTHNTIFHVVLFLMEQSMQEKPYSNIYESLLDELTINGIVERCGVIGVNPSIVYRQVDMLQNVLVTYGFNVAIKVDKEDKLVELVNEFINFLNKSFESDSNPHHTPFTLLSRDLLNGFYRYLNLTRGSMFNMPNPQFFYNSPNSPFHPVYQRPFW